MSVAMIIVRLAGSIGLFLYGMRILSDGIQRAAGDGLKRALNSMTGNTFKAILTGIGMTALIQSSSATTVMVVSFVNAGLLTVVQAAGVIFGSNIGTTVTAWIVSLIGYKFSIASIALPMVGAGFLLMAMGKAKSRARDYGEAALGFGLMFLGLEYLAHAIPTPSADAIRFLAGVSNMGILSVLIGVAVGAVFTMLIHASSASAALVITLAVEGVIDFNMAAAFVLGSNIGTTIDAFIASLGAGTNAKRAAWIHILFNLLGTVWAVALFGPFISLVNLLAGDSGIAQRIALVHTLFNTINAAIFAPFAGRFVGLVSRIIKAKPEDEKAARRLEYVAAPLMDSPELNLMRAQKEISDMAGLCGSMFARWTELLRERPADMAADIDSFRNMEEYADQMRDELSRFLIECAGHDMSASRQEDIGVMLRMVVDLEDITDDCFSLVMLLEKASAKKLGLGGEEVEALGPYTLLVEDILGFVRRNINLKISDEQLATAKELEDKIDGFRTALKKTARKRLQTGSDVKTELLFMDVIRHIEKIGDHAYGVASSLRDLK